METDNFGSSYLDSLAVNYPRATPDSTKFSMLNDLAYYWHTRNLNTALAFTRKGLALTASKNDTLWEGRFQITEGAILLRMEKLDSAERVLEDARPKVLEKDLPFLNTQLGYVFERRGQLDKAADYAMESLRLGEKLADKKAIAMAYSDLSNLFWKQSKYESGLEYGLKSVKIFEERNINDLDYDFTLYLVGNNYLALKDFEMALNYFNHAIAIGERYGFYNNLSDVYISQIDLYTYLNEFEKAEIAGVNAVKYAALLENEFMLMRSWLSIGKLQNIQGKYDSAIESLEKSIAIATVDFGDKFYLSLAYETLGKAYAGSHHYQEAYQAFATYDRLKSQVFTADADHRISELRTQFDVAHKENTIKLQEVQIERQRTQQILTFAFIGLLVSFLILLYQAIRNNIKKNRLLQKQNREKEFLIKEIHHRVKNNLEMVSSLLALQSAQMNDAHVKEAMVKSQHRIHSMGMIHQKLYQKMSLSSIRMKDYFNDLSKYVISVFDAGSSVEVLFDMEEIELDVDTAIPIGLIVNELLTNSLKYAFSKKTKKGTITIALTKKGQYLYLKVADNGIGKPSGTKHKGTGFGTQLIDLLTKQLEGKMHLVIANGTIFTFEFPHDKATQ